MHGAGMRPRFAQTYDSAGQAQYVAENIQALIAEGIPPGMIAVLYRAHFHSMEVQMELTRRRVPFVVRSGLGFFDAAHVKDVTAFLRLPCTPRTELSWKRLFLLSAGIGKVSRKRSGKRLPRRTIRWPHSCQRNSWLRSRKKLREFDQLDAGRGPQGCPKRLPAHAAHKRIRRRRVRGLSPGRIRELRGQAGRSAWLPSLPANIKSWKIF